MDFERAQRVVAVIDACSEDGSRDLLRGGRVIADWPGLKPAQLFEARDLAPTTDLRAVLKGLLRDHLRVDERVLASNVFPDSAGVAPTSGLVG